MSNITKKALEASLKKLMMKKPLDKITIRDITDDCGISRMTFYYHFQDIYDLIEWICLEDATAALQGKKTCATWNEGLEQIFEAVLDNKTFILNAYRCISREQMENFLFKMTYGLIRGVVDEKSAGTALGEEEKARAASTTPSAIFWRNKDLYKPGPMNRFCSPGRFCAWRPAAGRNALNPAQKEKNRHSVTGPARRKLRRAGFCCARRRGNFCHRVF